MASEKTTDPLFLPKHPRVKNPTELTNLRQLCLQLMKQEGQWNPENFPGSQPVSFERKHLGQSSAVSLQTLSFYAAEKTDGMRYMLVILGSRGTYAVDRRWDFIRLPEMHFTTRAAGGQQPGGGAVLDDTILDGELVVDTRRRGTEEGTIEKEKILRYLCYDACVVGGRCLMEEALPLRLMALRRDVLAPRYAAEGAGRDFSSEPFAVDQKDFFSVVHLPHIFGHVKPGTHESDHLYAYQDPLRRVEHGNDGVIFTPIMAPYLCGTCASILKWKPSNMNSIDFQLRTEWRLEKGRQTPRFSIAYAERGSLSAERYDWISFSEELHQRFVRDSKADQRIIECVFDPEHETITYPDSDDTWNSPVARKGGWKYERMREDKELPNDLRTVKAVEQSARDAVEMDELLESMRRR